MVLRLIQSAVLAACVLLAPASLLAAEAPSSGDVLLTVTGETGSPLRLTAADLAKLPRRTSMSPTMARTRLSKGFPWSTS